MNLASPLGAPPAVVLRGDAATLPLRDASVDLIVTSPPYFGLRSYIDGGRHMAEQVGAEATPTEYLDALIACTTEWMRVLKPGGSIFLVLGDKYSGYNVNGAAGRSLRGERKQRVQGGRNPADYGVPTKSLIGLPWRYAIRCIDELELILRAEIVWAKPNGLPESVTDRVRRAHEQVFHFVKQPRYYSAVDEVREGYEAKPQRRFSPRRTDEGRPPERRMVEDYVWNEPQAGTNPLGKLPGSVWTIPTVPLRVPESLGIDHFAAYPPELVRRIVLGWSPREVCTVCGEGRRPVVASQRTLDGQPIPTGQWKRGGVQVETSGVGNYRFGTERQLTGYACACPDTTAPSTPGVVLDPFGGTGTTALVASVHGRVGISVDLSADYCRLAQWRTTDEKQRAKAGAAPRPPRPAKPKKKSTDYQPDLTLFDETA